jgi:hypothetical protein
MTGGTGGGDSGSVATTHPRDDVVYVADWHGEKGGVVVIGQQREPGTNVR